MATVIPPTSNVEAAYEDMFKEITRKLYGEETGNGLHTLGTPVAQVATSGLTAVPEGEQRSFTNLQIDRSVQPTIEYEHNAGNGGALTATTVAAAAASTVTVVQNAANVIIQQQQQQQTAPEGSVVVTTTGAGGNFKSEDHLNTAFGLAALMQQNGFTTTTTGNILSTQAQVINKVITTAANVSGVGDQQQQQWHNEGAQDQQQQTHQQQAQIQGTTQIVQWTTTPSGKLQSYTTTTQPQTQAQTQNQPQLHTTPQQQQQSPQTQLNAVTASTSTTTHKTKSKNRQDADTMYANPSTSAIQNTPPSATLVATVNVTASGTDNPSSTLRKKSNHQQQQQQQQQQNSGSVQKRYVCTHCPYSTDRRDLYTRHENIHKDEKPFQCYVCMKQFNRADHVKKHFLRMHRDVQYDINKTRRHPPATSHQYRAGNNGGVGGGSGGGINAGVIDKGNVTIVTVNSNNANNNNSNDVKNLITLITNNLQTGDNVNLEQAFIESQRQPTSSSLSIAETIEAVASAADEPLPQLKQEKQDDDGGGVGLSLSGGNSSGGGGSGGGCLNVTVKPKREKRFTCLYCPWSGADKWGLKRHLNTHTKPFVCLLCDYKAARSERLSTHILKVHNKRACSKCNFLGDSLEEYQNHLKEAHPHFVPSQRQNVSTNINVLRTISNTLGNNNNNNNNNQLNQFQNNNNFSLNNNASNINNNGNSVTIYTTNDNQNGTTGGPLQEIIVNPATMGGWRLSTTGALIPPQDLLTNGLPNAAVQKRGSERLFQYLEADGSDTEDYSRLIKMDAISRNTASVAQDFRKAGGVQELNLPANNQQFLFNNKLPPTSTTTTTSPSNQWTTKEAAALLHSLSTNAHNLKLAYQQHMQSPQQQQEQQQHSTPTTAVNSYSYTNKKRKRQHSTGDDENTPSPTSSSNSSDSISPVLVHMGEQRKAMSAYLGKNFNLQETLLYSGCGPPTVAAVNELIAQVAATNRINGEISISSITHDLKHKQQQQQQQQHSIQDQENQEQLIRTSPAYKNKSNNNKQQQQHTKIKSSSSLTFLYNHQQQQQQTQMRNSTNLSHCLDLQHNKENNQDATALLAQLDFQNLNKIEAQFQNYIKDIINKYYVGESTPQMLANMTIPTNITATAQWAHSSPSHERQRPHNHQLPQTPPKRKRMLSETEEYIEYLKNKEDITLTITPKVSNGNKSPAASATPPTLPSKMNYGSPVKRERDLASDSYKRQSPKKSHINQSNGVSHYSTNGHNKHNNKKNLNQLATLLPLLAEAASKQQYLTAPLDFSKKPNNNSHPTNNVMHTVTHNRPNMYDKRTSRKQAQPKKIKMAPEVIIGLLRDKYLNRMVRRKLSCWKCLQKKRYSMLVFNYHTKATLTLHTYWKHPRHSLKISKWKLKKLQTSMPRINKIRAVGKRANSENVKQ